MMQYCIAFSSFTAFLRADESNASAFDQEDGRVSDRLLIWADKHMQHGMDGEVIVDVLNDWGIQLNVSQRPAPRQGARC